MFVGEGDAGWVVSAALFIDDGLVAGSDETNGVRRLIRGHDPTAIGRYCDIRGGTIDRSVASIAPNATWARQSDCENDAP
jgi:hypothetical protein